MMKDVGAKIASLADATHMYPPGDSRVVDAAARLESALGRAHMLSPLVVLGLSEEGFTVNGEQLTPKELRFKADTLFRLLRRRAIGEVRMAIGVTEAEVQSFFRVITTYEDPPSAETLAERGVRNIAIERDLHRLGAQRRAALLADTGVADDQPTEELPEKPRTVAAPRPKRDRLYETAVTMLPAKLVNGSSAKGVPSLVSALAPDRLGDAHAVLNRVMEARFDSSPTIRLAGLELVKKTLAGVARPVARNLIAGCVDALSEWLMVETDRHVQLVLLRMSAVVVLQLLVSKDLCSAGTILWQLGRGRFATGDHLPPQVAYQAQAAVNKVMQSAAFEAALDELRSTDIERQALAKHLLESCGRPAAGRLIQLLEAANRAGRRNFATQLRAVASEDCLAILCERVTPEQPAGRVVRMLEVADLMVDDLWPVIARSVQHPDPAVHLATRALLQRSNAAMQQRVLLGLLDNARGPLLELTINWLGDLRVAGATAHLLALLEHPDAPVNVQIAICRALGRLQEPAAVPPLVDLVKSSRLSRMFKRDAPGDLRLAAVWALAGYDTPEAKTAISTLIHDKDPLIAAAAQTVSQGGQ